LPVGPLPGQIDKKSKVVVTFGENSRHEENTRAKCAVLAVIRDTQLVRELLTGVGVANFAGLVRVEPDLALTALEDGSGKPLLQTKQNHL